MKTRLRTIWKLSVAILMLWLLCEAWGVTISELPFWRTAVGGVLLLIFAEYLKQAAEDAK